jgi:ribosome-binding ATPase YchF (GTP1/OBG family)
MAVAIRVGSTKSIQEIMHDEDYVNYHGEHGAREAGKLRLAGQDYVLHDGEIMHFHFDV